MICWKGYSLIKEFFENGSSGGVISSLAYCILEMKLAEGIVCLNRSGSEPSWFIAKSKADLLKAAGSIYEDVRFEYSPGLELRILAQVGKPCDLSNLFSPRIALFCSHSYRRQNHVLTKADARVPKSKFQSFLDNPFRCFLCLDHVGFHSDVSVGDSQSDPKVNVILVHSEIGKKIVDFAVNHKYLELRNIDLKEIKEKQPYLWRFKK